MMDTFEKLILIQKCFNLLKHKAKQTIIIKKEKKKKHKKNPYFAPFHNSAHFNHNLVMATKHQKIFFKCIFSMVLKKQNKTKQ